MSRMSASTGTGSGTGMKSIRRSPRSTRPPARSRWRRPYSQYGYRKDQRYFAVNVFCELDRPGEWYLDRRRGMVYWLPPGDFDPAKDPDDSERAGRAFRRDGERRTRDSPRPHVPGGTRRRSPHPRRRRLSGGRLHPAATRRRWRSSSRGGGGTASSAAPCTRSAAAARGLPAATARRSRPAVTSSRTAPSPTSPG